MKSIIQAPLGRQLGRFPEHFSPGVDAVCRRVVWKGNAKAQHPEVIGGAALAH